MREPSFWRRDGVPARLLAPLAAIYGAVAAMRMQRTGARAGVPVICIGNLTVGGAGKTPTAIAIARRLLAAGNRPVFLTRGYGGSLAGPVRVTPEHSAAEVGDEPLLLARVAPTIVARDRAMGAQAAMQLGDVIVMDDGFQNPALAKDLSIVVLDGERGIGNGRVIPAGPLRAPVDRQLDRTGAILVVGVTTAACDSVMAAAAGRGIPVLRGRLDPDAEAVATLRGKRVLAFAGIAAPEKFFKTLADAGIGTVTTRAFPDHHRFARAEAGHLLTQATRQECVLVTTDKDLARMQGDAELGALAAASTALPVTLRFEDEAALVRLLQDALRGRGPG